MAKLPVGIQVYGLRDLIIDNPAANFKPVMQRVKELGYDGVELAGTFDLDPAYIRSVMDEVGLTVISAHLQLADLTANIEQIIHDYTIIGAKYLTVSWLPEEIRPGTPGFAPAVAQMREVGAKLAAAGFTMLYHNHDFEFMKMEDGAYALDHIYSEVPADLLKAEPDTCWITVAGENPAAYIEKYSGRVEITHVKDYVKRVIPNSDRQFEFRAVGFGEIEWEPILNASLAAGAKWIIVEQDQHYDLCPLECARRSREYLKILGW